MTLVNLTLFFSLLTRAQFEDAGLHPVMMENIKLAGYDQPTPVQMYTIPAVLKGYDVVAIAQTGEATSREPMCDD
jgi:superfamily II DNA/RNA helicase